MSGDLLLTEVPRGRPVNGLYKRPPLVLYRSREGCGMISHW